MILNGKQAEKEIKGIGKKMLAKIDELLTTGKLDRLERERNDKTQQAVTQLQRVSGVGSVRAMELHTKHNIDTIAMLRGAALSDKTLLNHEQTIGLRHLEDFEARIPRTEMRRLESLVRKHCDAHDPPLQMTVCGSYRRGKADSGDIDCLLCHPSFARRDTPEREWPLWLTSLTTAMRESGFVTDVLGQGRKKAPLVCRLPDEEDEKKKNGGGGGGSTAAAAAADSGEAAANAVVAAVPPPVIRLPTLEELKAKKAGLKGTQKTDLFAERLAAKEKEKEAAAAAGSGGGGGGMNGNGKAPAADQSSSNAFVASAAEDDDEEPNKRRYRRLDLRLCAAESYHAMTLYFTGSDEHNKLMRSKAIELGYRLNEYGLFKVDADGVVAERPEKADCEEDIYKLLGMAYLEPTARNIT